MQATRPLVFVAALLTFVVSACSQPNALSTPTLEPQFGTPGHDSVEDVAYSKAGALYAVGMWSNSENTRAYGDGGPPQTSDAYLRRYDRSGNLVWENFFDLEAAHQYSHPQRRISSWAVASDSGGNAIVAWSADYLEHDGNYFQVIASYNYLSKYTSSGTKVWRVYTGGNRIKDLATDGSGNVYGTSGDFFTPGTFVKYTSSGAKAWEKSMPSGRAAPAGVAVSSTNYAYLLRENGVVAKYSSGGTLLWSKATAPDDNYTQSYKIAAGLNNELFVVRGYQYASEQGEGCDGGENTAYYYAQLYKLNKSGERQWFRNAAKMEVYDGGCGGGNDAYGWEPQDGLSLATDSLGNVYTVGGTDNNDAFATKHNRSGTRLWSKTFGTNGTDGATSVATYDGTKVFVGGVTYGYLVHRPLGGTDAFLRGMDKSGNRVWTR